MEVAIFLSNTLLLCCFILNVFQLLKLEIWLISGLPSYDEQPPYHPGSFDKIILDPPCSGIGQRPQLQCSLTSSELQSYPVYQRKLFEQVHTDSRAPNDQGAGVVAIRLKKLWRVNKRRVWKWKTQQLQWFLFLVSRFCKSNKCIVITTGEGLEKHSKINNWERMIIWYS